MALKLNFVLLCFLSFFLSVHLCFATKECFGFEKIAFAGTDKATALDETVRIYKQLWQDLGQTVSPKQKLSLLEGGDPLVIPKEFAVESDSLRQAFQELKQLTESAGLKEAIVNARLKETLQEIIDRETLSESSIKKEMRKSLLTPVIEFPNLTKHIRWSPNGAFVVGIIDPGVAKPKTIGLLVHTSDGQSKTYFLSAPKEIKDVAISNTGTVFLVDEDQFRTVKPLDKNGKLLGRLRSIPFKQLSEAGTWFDPRAGFKLSFSSDFSKIILKTSKGSTRATSTDKKNKLPIIPDFFSADFPHFFELDDHLYALESAFFQDNSSKLDFVVLDASVQKTKNSGQKISVPGLPRRISQNSAGDKLVTAARSEKALRVFADFYELRHKSTPLNPFELLELNLETGTGERISIQGEIVNVENAEHPQPLSESRALILTFNEKGIPQFYSLNLLTGQATELADVSNEYSAQKFWSQVGFKSTKYETIPNTNLLVLKNESGTTQTLVDLTPYL